jgi:hypothetical protein
MSSKKKTSPSTAAGLPPIQIGSRVRCTDDGVQGRIVWANAVSVKIRWDDGGQVTWRRNALAGKPVEILGGCSPHGIATVHPVPGVPEVLSATRL